LFYRNCCLSQRFMVYRNDFCPLQEGDFLVVAPWVMLTTGVASGHFVNLSMATKRNQYTPTTLGNGPRISTPIRRMAKRVESSAEPELVCVSALSGTGTPCRTLPSQLHPGERLASKSHAGRPYRPVCGMMNDFFTLLHGYS
jgi:hypothetical protein